MKKRLKKTFRKARKKPFLVFRLLLILIISTTTLGYLSINVLAAFETTSKSLPTVPVPQNGGTISSLPEVKGESIKIAEQKQQADEKRKLEVAKKMAIRDQNIKRINTFLVKKKSPVANTKIAEILYDLSLKYGGDYKVLLSIMGVESGFCRASFSYNCFGFLNGVKYKSYEQAFNDIVPKVTKRYVLKYHTDFVSLAKAYGMINWEKGAANLKMYYNQI